MQFRLVNVLVLATLILAAIPTAASATQRKLTRRECGLAVAGTLAALAGSAAIFFLRRKDSQVVVHGENHDDIEYRRDLFRDALNGKIHLLVEDYLVTQNPLTTTDLFFDLHGFGFTPNNGALIKGIADPFRYVPAALWGIEQNFRQYAQTGDPNFAFRALVGLVGEKLNASSYFTAIWKEMLSLDQPFVHTAPEWAKIDGGDFLKKAAKWYLIRVDGLMKTERLQLIILQGLRKGNSRKQVTEDLVRVGQSFLTGDEILYFQMMIRELQRRFAKLALSPQFAKAMNVPRAMEKLGFNHDDDFFKSVVIDWNAEAFVQNVFEYRAKINDGKPIHVIVGESHREELRRLGLP